MIRCLCHQCGGRVTYLTIDAYLAHAGDHTRAFVLVRPRPEAN